MRIRFFCYFFILCFPIFSTLAQSNFFETVRSSRKLCGYSITEMSNRDVVIVGSSFAAGNRDALVLRFNSEGKLEWKKAFGGASVDQFRAVVEAADAGYLAVGFSESFGGAGQSEIVLAKFTSNGSVQWKKLIGSSGIDKAMSLTNTSDGNVVLVGSTSSMGDGDVVAIKLNSITGAIIWQKAYGVPGSSEVGYSVSSTPNGAIVIAGETQYSNHNHNAFILRLDSQGNFQWARTLRNSWVEWRSSLVTETPISVTTLNDGSAVLALNRSVDLSPILVKFNSAGNRIWAKKYGDQNTVWSIHTVNDGFLVSGEWGVLAPWFLAFKTDLAGKVKWHRAIDPQNAFDSFSVATSSAPAGDSTYFFTGCIGADNLEPHEEVLPFLKLDRFGNISGSCSNFITPQQPIIAKSVPTPFTPIVFASTNLSFTVSGSSLGEKSISASDSTVCKGTGGDGPQCGNSKCEAGEDSKNCPQDCRNAGPVCGNGQCESGETNNNCPQDCKNSGPVCGNGKCESGENSDNCSEDCKEPPPDNCHPCYSVCLDPNHDVDCGEIPFRNFHACASDPYRLDGDNDGIACED